ncbi:MAG TPA: DUF3499 domain-containing protein [Natronosporangium sp.]|nr:DUF3499 domain-containing protein [Natronosporangium sp.]
MRPRPGGRDRATPGTRRCTRNGCPAPAVATLTYVYATSTAVVGPLAVVPEPHTYDLCGPHARTLTAPRGWELVRQVEDLPLPPDDLTALAEAVRDPRPSTRLTPERPGPAEPPPRRAPDGGRNVQLRLVPPS